MATEDRELGPFKPAPDMLILAAIERAMPRCLRRLDGGRRRTPRLRAHCSQHPALRHARVEAGRRMDGLRTLLYEALEDADPVATAFTPPNSATWFALGQRLGAAFWLLGSGL